MEDDSSWEALPIERIRVPAFNFRVISEASNGENELPVSLDAVVPGDILEKIFTFLPIASMIRSTAVCKRWHDIIYSSRYLWTHMLPQRHWYFMFTCNETSSGYAYDPILHKWYDLELQGIDKSSCFCLFFLLKRLLEPPGAKFPDYSTVAIKVDQVTHNYTVTLAKSKQVPEDYVQWGVLFIQSTGVLGNVEPRHRLIMTQWQEVSRMPHKFFQGFGELDDVFCRGADHLVYIQSYGATALLGFDMKQRQWKWSAKCPVSKKFPLQLFTGFCFEPRLDITT
ncbi:hypothetical protein ZWY2020_048006 [Hordeum vulgare]|nr:hypothetical protein ZWY2020_048006 [Hordeum vulgare]